MNLVKLPLAHSAQPGSKVTHITVRAMVVGQHLMALVLTSISVARAVSDGATVATAVLAGVAILAWHTAGALLPATSRSPRVAAWWLVGFVVVWIAAVAVSAEFVWLSFLLWLLAGHLLPLRLGLLFSIFVFAVVAAGQYFHHGAISFANLLGPLIGGVFAFGISRGYLQLLRDSAERERLVGSLTRAQAEMSELQDELALAQRVSGALAERTRISRDIHDTIAQALSSIRLLAHAGSSRTSDADAARTFTQLETLAGESLADVRRIVAALVPAELENNALVAALQRMLDRAHEEAGLQTELHVAESLPQLPTAVEVALLRAAQSALSNVRMHAAASKVRMSLSAEAETVRLDIVDNGQGFDAAPLFAASPPAVVDAASSFGLRFMQQRMRELGGRLAVVSAPGAGTTISINLPVHFASGAPEVIEYKKETS